MRRWRSGQTRRTVNPLAIAYAGSNPARRTKCPLWGLFVWREQSKLLCSASGFEKREYIGAQPAKRQYERRSRDYLTKTSHRLGGEV